MSKSFKIYTKTGDQGTSSLYNGERRPKTDILFEALGAVDELTSFLGISRSYCETSTLSYSGDEDTMRVKVDMLNELREQIAKVQATLQGLNAHIATPRTLTASNFKLDRTNFDPDGSLTVELERWIDAYDAQLPPLKVFILPGGSLASSHLHYCRTLTRRAERQLFHLVEVESVSSAAGRYINRLSDFLFMAARIANKAEGIADLIK